MDAASANRRDKDVLVLDENSKFEVSSPHAYLFRVLDDASEQNNLFDDHPDVVDLLLARLVEHRANMAPCEWRDDDADASDFFQKDGFVGPWWKKEQAPPPLSANCADVGDHDVSRFTLPQAQADDEGAQAPDASPLRARRRRRLS